MTMGGAECSSPRSTIPVAPSRKGAVETKTSPRTHGPRPGCSERNRWFYIQIRWKVKNHLQGLSSDLYVPTHCGTHVYTHTGTYECTHICIYLHMYAHSYTHSLSQTQTQSATNSHVNIHTHVLIYTHTSKTHTHTNKYQ